MQWILASASPRRKELLRDLLPAFEILPAKGEEKADESLPPKMLVQELAKAKAQEVASLREAEGKAVIGADTVVAYGGKILGKPRDERHAEEMLVMLSGQTHEVYTGVCVILPDGRELLEADCTQVVFEPLDKAFIKAYVETGSPMDKAGAYGIQDGGLVKEIRGSYSNVVGFPVELFKKMLEGIK